MMDTFIDLFKPYTTFQTSFRALLSNMWLWINKTLGVLTFFGPLGICSTLYCDYLQSIAQFRDVTLSVFVYAFES